jgi:hypothetical protein
MGILARRVLCLGQESAEWSSFRGGRAMASDDKPKKERAGETARAKMKPSTERPFDAWLQKQLHAMYDEIASEPLPQDLLGLIESDAAKKGKPPGPSRKR